MCIEIIILLGVADLTIITACGLFFWMPEGSTKLGRLSRKIEREIIKEKQTGD